VTVAHHCILCFTYYVDLGQFGDRTVRRWWSQMFHAKKAFLI